jgi:hypothetical protein
LNERASIPPIEQTIADERQSWARHYGVHPYFTRRSATVVRAYLDRYTRMGDVVLGELLKDRGLRPTPPPAIDLFLVGVTPEDQPHLLGLAHELRDAGLRLEYAFGEAAVGHELDPYRAGAWRDAEARNTKAEAEAVRLRAHLGSVNAVCQELGCWCRSR